MESAIITTIINLTLKIAYLGFLSNAHLFPSTFPIIIVSYCIVSFFPYLFTPFVPCTKLEFSTLSTMHYWISISVVIP